MKKVFAVLIFLCGHTASAMNNYYLEQMEFGNTSVVGSTVEGTSAHSGRMLMGSDNTLTTNNPLMNTPDFTVRRLILEASPQLPYILPGAQLLPVHVPQVARENTRQQSRERFMAVRSNGYETYFMVGTSFILGLYAGMRISSVWHEYDN